MAVNPLTHLSNTICYIDKPTASQAEKARLEADKRVEQTGARIDDTGIFALDNTDGKTKEPGPSVNGAGQTLGRIINAIA